MKAIRILPALALLAMAASPALAQNAVQLPTYSSFRANTTVSVPDRGSVYTGGINRAASGRNEFGTPLLPLRNRSIGSERSASSVWTSAYIHDLEAMDEALLSQARDSTYRAPVHRSLGSSIVSGGSRPSQSPRGTWNSRSTPQRASGPLTKSVAQLKAEHSAVQQARAIDAERLYEHGKNAEAKGKLSVARIFYQQASRRAEGPLQQEILAQLRLVSTTSVAQR